MGHNQSRKAEKTTRPGVQYMQGEEGLSISVPEYNMMHWLTKYLDQM